MSSFFPWMGGKSRIAKRLVATLPEHQCYVEPFAGAANLLFVKDKSETEVLNDINGELVNLFRILRWHPRELFSELFFSLHSRADYSSYMSQPGLTDIQRAARSWFTIKTAFGGRAGTSSPVFGYGTTGKAHFRRSVFAAARRCHRRLDGVYIENLDFEDCIRRYDRPHTAFYCDPPYLGTGGYKAPFGLDDHRRLAVILRSIKGKFLLSVNNDPRIVALYRGCTIRKLAVKYTVSLDKSSKAQDRTELVIANYPLPKRL